MYQAVYYIASSPDLLPCRFLDLTYEPSNKLTAKKAEQAGEGLASFPGRFGREKRPGNEAREGPESRLALYLSPRKSMGMRLIHNSIYLYIYL